MAYRESKDAVGRARDRLRAAEERVSEQRALVERASCELGDALRAIELARLEHGAAAARVRQQSALAKTQPSVELETDLRESKERLSATRLQIPVWEQAIAERRAELRVARRALGAAERERRQAENELLRLG